MNDRCEHEDEAPERDQGDVPLTLAGEKLLLSPRRGMYWPDRGILFVADVHLGKASTFRAEGIPIPRGDMDADLDRLTQLISQFEPSRLVVLGDLFHAAAGMDDDTLGRVRRWRERHSDADLSLVVGNHDRSAGTLPEWLQIQSIDGPLVVPPFALVHNPMKPLRDGPDPRLYRVGGHLHPGIRLRDGTWSERLPCFHVTRRAMVLPAFSAFTGLSDISPGPNDQVFMIADDTVIEMGR